MAERQEGHRRTPGERGRGDEPEIDGKAAGGRRRGADGEEEMHGHGDARRSPE
jgi:hypothetical protein